MSDVSMSPEERERIVAFRIREILGKIVDEDDAFIDKLTKRMRSSASPAPQQQQGQQVPSQQVPQRKRSMFEIAMSETLGLG